MLPEEKKNMKGIKKCLSKRIYQIKMHVTEDIIWVWRINKYKWWFYRFDK